jgi:demethylmenaquinone methyltransferase/2-methoxy-6-polyprenyl-1,4-benzoquinol methylase
MGIEPEDRILDLGAGTGRNACLMAAYLSPSGAVTALDISKEMIEQFERKCAAYPNIRILNRRIDLDLEYRESFDKVFISFVLHGFPHDVRRRIIRNAFRALRSGGAFFIFDYNTFQIKDQPFYIRWPFLWGECPYAFDFIEKDWKRILSEEGFGDFEEKIFFRGTVRLLKAVKVRGT